MSLCAFYVVVFLYRLRFVRVLPFANHFLKVLNRNRMSPPRPLGVSPGDKPDPGAAGLAGAEDPGGAGAGGRQTPRGGGPAEGRCPGEGGAGGTEGGGTGERGGLSCLSAVCWVC